MWDFLLLLPSVLRCWGLPQYINGLYCFHDVPTPTYGVPVSTMSLRRCRNSPYESCWAPTTYAPRWVSGIGYLIGACCRTFPSTTLVGHSCLGDSSRFCGRYSSCRCQAFLRGRHMDLDAWSPGEWMTSNHVIGRDLRVGSQHLQVMGGQRRYSLRFDYSFSCWRNPLRSPLKSPSNIIHGIQWRSINGSGVPSYIVQGFLALYIYANGSWLRSPNIGAHNSSKPVGTTKGAKLVGGQNGSKLVGRQNRSDSVWWRNSSLLLFDAVPA